MKLSDSQTLMLKQALLTEAVKTTQSYISDIVVDFTRLDRWNSNEIVPEDLIFIARGSGTELNIESDETVIYWLKAMYQNYLQSKIRETEPGRYAAYRIDVSKLGKISDEPKPANLYAPTYSSLIDEDCYKCQCIKNLTIQEVGDILKAHSDFDVDKEEEIANKAVEQFNIMRRHFALID